MRVCQNCGYQNEETAAICARCNQALPPPAVPAQPPTGAPTPWAPIQLPAAQAQDSQRKRRQYLLGLGLGLIPLIVFFLGIGLVFQTNSVGTVLLFTSLALYLASLVAMIVCLSIQKVRFVGYGLMTTVLAAPAIAFISCVVVIVGRPFG